MLQRGGDEREFDRSGSSRNLDAKGGSIVRTGWCGSPGTTAEGVRDFRVRESGGRVVMGIGRVRGLEALDPGEDLFRC